jgi:hypothetical protein
MKEGGVTEAEWLTCTDSKRMLDFAEGQLTARKIRLLAIGHCRLSWELLPEQCRGSVEVAERFADGRATTEELEWAQWRANNVVEVLDGRCQQTESDEQLPFTSSEEEERYNREMEICHKQLSAAASAYDCAIPHLNVRHWDITGGQICDLIRDAVANPFRKAPAVNPCWLAWNGGTISKLAAAIYEDRAFDRLPLLADALEAAACRNAALLGHLRGPGPHCRGCWAVDLLLGKV